MLVPRFNAIVCRACIALAFLLALPVNAITPQLDAGGGFVTAIKSDGSLWTWGVNASRLGDGTVLTRLSPVQIGTGYISASAGDDLAAAVKADGTLWAWGPNPYGNIKNSNTPVLIGTGFKSTVIGHRTGYAIKTDGSLWAWGANEYGQLGDGTTTASASLKQIGTGFVAVSSNRHVLALKADGSLWAWGYNASGQVGNGKTTGAFMPGVLSPVNIGTNFTAISAGAGHSVALQADGSLWTWGENCKGQLATGSVAQTCLPVDFVLTPTKVGNGYVAIAAGGTQTYAINQNGSLLAWGDNTVGQLGNGLTESVPGVLPSQVGSGFSTVSAHYYYAFALKADGTLWAWGGGGWVESSNDIGQYGGLGTGNTAGSLVPVQVASGFGGTTATSTGATTTTLSTTTTTHSSTNTTINPSSNVIPKISAGWTHSMALKSDGGLWVWGSGSWCQIGDGSTNGAGVNNSSLVPLNIGAGYIDISAGGYHSAAIKSDGSLWTWGRGNLGQLGNGGTAQCQRSPQQIGTGYKAVAAGAQHTIALKTDGSLWAWGENTVGQIGDGSFSDQITNLGIGSKVPKQIGIGYAAIATWANFNLALKADGTLWGWGYNSNGEAGIGAIKGVAVPTQIGSGFVSIAAGLHHAVALKADGTLWTWGSNYLGQQASDIISTASGHEVLSPRQVQVGNRYAAIAAGEYQTFAIASDGGLWAWGDNRYGQRGNGGTATSATGNLVGSGYVAVSAGAYHVMALKADGSLWTWGGAATDIYNDGQLGDGMKTGSLVPKQVATGFTGLTLPVVDSGTSTSNTTTTVGSTSTTTNYTAPAACSTPPAGTMPAVNVPAGWSLLGNGTLGTITLTSAFCNPAQVITAWKWDSAASSWAFYAPSLSSTALASYAAGKGYSVLATVQPGEGFWINASAPTSITGFSYSGRMLPPSDLSSGWNLKASADNQTPSQWNFYNSAVLAAAGKAVQTVWAWDAATSRWKFYAPSLEAQGGTTLADYIAGKGYEAFTSPLGMTDGFWVNLGQASASAAPVITGISPTSGSVGTSVTITGSNFSSTLSGNTVTFGGIQAVIASASTTSLTTTVPVGAASGQIKVITGIGSATYASNFTVTTGSTGSTSGSGVVYGCSYPSDHFCQDYYDGLSTSSCGTAQKVSACPTGSIATCTSMGAFAGNMVTRFYQGYPTSAIADACAWQPYGVLTYP